VGVLKSTCSVKNPASVVLKSFLLSTSGGGGGTAEVMITKS